MWIPIADSEISRRCWNAIEGIERGLVQVMFSGTSVAPAECDPRLASGHAGLALFFAYLDEARPSAESADRALAALDRSIDALEETRLTPSLYSGFSGIGWTVEHLNQESFEEDDDLSAEIEEALRALISSPDSRPQYELINGLSGFGVYLIERLPRPGAVELLGRILDRLLAMEEESETGITWYTPPEWLSLDQRKWRPNGHYSLGVSHGVPGVLGFLAAAQRAGFEDRRIPHLAAGIVRWLLDQKLPEKVRSVFPSSFVPGEVPEPTRTAWCYGDIGVAAVLLSAAREFGRPDWEEEALGIARLAARRPLEAVEVMDAGLCHGSAGLAQLFNRFYQATGDREMKEAALTWYRRTLDARRPGEGIAGFLSYVSNGSGGPGSWKAEPGFLIGAAGVGLALLAAVTDIEPAWDRAMLISIPPRNGGEGGINSTSSRSA
ncbi:MAG TPA: lanthionine synthetase C family protein [Thermoanaerobaculia bacterium]|jgi:lantibiotic modifying enzyme|nr:lanthionine synthetase C family protein [Thermoanaerobaculia bacterium]